MPLAALGGVRPRFVPSKRYEEGFWHPGSVDGVEGDHQTATGGGRELFNDVAKATATEPTRGSAEVYRGVITALSDSEVAPSVDRRRDMRCRQAQRIRSGKYAGFG